MDDWQVLAERKQALDRARCLEAENDRLTGEFYATKTIRVHLKRGVAKAPGDLVRWDEIETNPLRIAWNRLLRFLSR